MKPSPAHKVVVTGQSRSGGGLSDTPIAATRSALPVGSADPVASKRVALILRQIDTLPTLPAVATRLLTLTASDDSSAREVIELVSSDPPLTAKILSMCRRSNRGVREEATTIDKAVVLLGFNAIRNAVLSIKVFEIFQNAPPPSAAQDDAVVDDQDKTPPFDRIAFWRHSVGVAIAAELLAKAGRGERNCSPSEAFVCGLLHDIGKLALDHMLPRSYHRVIELTELNQGNISEFERRIIGLDHHTAGKRLAEQWQLPQVIHDCIWLHGSTYDTLPQLEHRRMIGLVSLADLIVRHQHIGYSGNFAFNQEVDSLCTALSLDPQRVGPIRDELHSEVVRRSALLGLDETPSEALLLSSLAHANNALGKVNAALHRRTATASRQGQVLEAITTFHGNVEPGRNVQDVMTEVVASAASVFGAGYYATIFHPGAVDEGECDWLVCQYNEQCRPMRAQWIEPAPGVADLSTMEPGEPASMTLMGILPWIADYLVESADVRRVRLLPLTCGWGTPAVLLHDRQLLPPWQQLVSLTTTWGAAIAAAGRHDAAHRLSEQLAETNLALADAQDRLLRQESMARLGEMASGAAHEMNNPLTVISGRAQMLADALAKDTDAYKSARLLVEQSQRLSDLITSLRLFTDPPQPERKKTDVSSLLEKTIKKVRADATTNMATFPIGVTLKSRLPPVSVDPDQVGGALKELLLNALQSKPATMVQITVRLDETDQVLHFQVADDGVGMDTHTLSHAMDPFFSAKPAGRQVGMGLPRAQQLAAAHGGRVELRSAPGQGTVATLLIGLD